MVMDDPMHDVQRHVAIEHRIDQPDDRDAGRQIGIAEDMIDPGADGEDALQVGELLE